MKICEGAALGITEFRCPTCGNKNITYIHLEQKVPVTWAITGIENGKICAPYSFESHDPEEGDDLLFVCSANVPGTPLACGRRWSAKALDKLELINWGGLG